MPRYYVCSFEPKKPYQKKKTAQTFGRSSHITFRRTELNQKKKNKPKAMNDEKKQPSSFAASFLVEMQFVYYLQFFILFHFVGWNIHKFFVSPLFTFRAERSNQV